MSFVQVRIVVAVSGGSMQTVEVRRFTGMISSSGKPLDSDCDSVAFIEYVNENLRFTQYGTKDEYHDDGEVHSQDTSLVQDNPLNRKRNGVSTKYNETIIATEKQKQHFWKRLLKIASQK
jgi:hypothetical protein